MLRLRLDQTAQASARSFEIVNMTPTFHDPTLNLVPVARLEPPAVVAMPLVTVLTDVQALLDKKVEVVQLVHDAVFVEQVPLAGVVGRAVWQLAQLIAAWGVPRSMKQASCAG